MKINKHMANKILIIEDDRFLRKIYKNKLEAEGFEVVEAIEGEEGLHKVSAEMPDLVVLDLMLPRKDGFDVLADIKKNPQIKDIPVVILTVLGQESDVKRGLDLGAANYLVKGQTDLNQVIKVIKQTLGTK
jgi:DNA-binding response OmpR family regulator